MSKATLVHKPVVDWLTVVAIAVIAICANVALHEGVHALTCLVVGGHLQVYSALYASCNSPTELHAKIVAGSAPTINLIVGACIWFILRNSRKQPSEILLLLWLFMLMNLCYGAGYLIFSGVVNIDDWAVVIRDWKPNWLWRTLIVLTGTLIYLCFIQLILQEFAIMIGGYADDQIHRANKVLGLSYVTSFTVVLIAGFFCPYGLFSPPVTAGLSGVLGALLPFLWMVRWFRSKNIEKAVKEPMEIHRKWQWLAAAVSVVFTYVFNLAEHCTSRKLLLR